MTGTDSFGFVGSVLDQNYRVDGVLGEGGFGVVYRGWHLAFDEPVAIKCLKVPPHFTAEARQLFEQRFREEGRLLRKLGERHSAVVRAHDVRILHGAQGHIASVPYLVLELLDGDTFEGVLRQRLAGGQGPFGEAETIALLAPVMEALALTHQGSLGHVIAHRDIKPENLFLLRDGRVKVLDFGIAKAMQEGEQLTQQKSQTSSGFSAFTPSYGAPEQFSARKYGESGPWTDVHALGLVLSEMVSGRHPYNDREGQYADMLMEAIATERPTPRRRGAQVSDAFEAVCARALALRPQDRYANAGELLAALLECGQRRVPTIMAPPMVTSLPVELVDTAPMPPPAKGGTVAGPPVAGAMTGAVAGQTPAGAARGTEFNVPRVVEAAPALEPPAPVRVESAPVLVKPPPSRRKKASSGRSPRGWRLAVGGGLVLLAGGALAWRVRSTAEDQEPAAEATEQPSVRLGHMVKIPGGTFTMGNEDAGFNERPTHLVTLATFWLDQTEVTVSAFKRCVDEGPCVGSAVVVKDGTERTEHQTSSQACNWDQPDRGEHPINCVDAEEAETFCKWAGKRLPTEREWEYAAKSKGIQENRFPWGDEEPNGQLCWRRTAGTCAVGSYPGGNTATKLKDMAGNVLEWTYSHGCPYTSTGYDSDHCSAGQVVRGGHWNDDEADAVRTTRRRFYAQATSLPVVGFRCARDGSLERFAKGYEGKGGGAFGARPPSPPHAGGEARWKRVEAVGRGLSADRARAVRRPFAGRTGASRRGASEFPQRASPPACGGLGGPRAFRSPSLPFVPLCKPL